ncbi:MAG: hypothetical protein LBE78_01840 [Burkholderiaceae bacterium]|jgi:hypothetical protein|nr:hypothetical protein [Burkholderiaceae bacterium]
MSNRINPLSLMASAPLTNTSAHRQGKPSSWYEAMAEAWGKTLDSKAHEIEVSADQLSAGDDTPAHITQMTALAQQMSFMSNSAHTSLQSVGTALETVARKQ